MEGDTLDPLSTSHFRRDQSLVRYDAQTKTLARPCPLHQSITVADFCSGQGCSYYTFFP